MTWKKHWDINQKYAYELPVFKGASIWANQELEGYHLMLEVCTKKAAKGLNNNYLRIPLGEFANATQAKRAAEQWLKEVKG